MTDWIDLLSKLGPTSLLLAIGWAVATGRLILPRELGPLRDNIEERDQRIERLEKELRKAASDSLEQSRKQWDLSRSEVLEIRKTMHELIAAFSHPSGPEGQG